MIDVEYSPRFLRSLGKLTQDLKDRAQAREVIFKLDPFDPRLDTHKLRGKDHEHWAYWVTSKIRIKFIFLDNKKVLYLDIGTHDKIYY